MFKLDHVYPSFPKKNKKSGKRRRFPLFPAANAPPGGSVAYRKTTGAEARGIVGIGIIAMSIIRIIIP
jgi:hypothetical protein